MPGMTERPSRSQTSAPMAAGPKLIDSMRSPATVIVAFGLAPSSRSISVALVKVTLPINSLRLFALECRPLSDRFQFGRHAKNGQAVAFRTLPGLGLA